MNVMVFDTETVSVTKPFCYNIGYKIVNTNSLRTVLRRDFVVEQVWHNLSLFATAYYADKRQLYVSAMRGKNMILDKFGYICSTMRRDIKNHNVRFAYAYNSSFDDRVFEFNCDWFKVINPFETVQILDIRGNCSEIIFRDQRFFDFCEKNYYFTETGNYSGTAETAYRYVTGNTSFIEEHTAAADSDIEADILIYTILNGTEWGVEYPTISSMVRGKPYKISVDKKIVFEGSMIKKYERNGHLQITSAESGK